MKEERGDGRHGGRGRIRFAVPVAVGAALLGGGAAAIAIGDDQAAPEVRDGAPAVVGARALVAEGETTQGRTYRLSAYTSVRGPCLQLHLGENPDASTACGLPRTLGYVTVDDLERGERLVYGAVAGNVAVVRARLETGRWVAARTARAAGGQRAYLLSLPDSDGALTVELRAEAEDGRLLAEERLAFGARRRSLPQDESG